MDKQNLWYKDAVIYQLHVKCYYDSNGDGIGDFPGLIKKLDHIVKLGVTAIWLLPFYPSPLKDDGYDIADYTDIHPDYGKLSDFKAFLKEAHARNLKVITELVINHTSDQHRWFQASRKAKPDSKWRSYYTWSDTQEKYSEARIIFNDFETSNWQWDPVANAYYWHRFYSHQPDLNFESPYVKKEIFRIVDFWLKMGVDGLRLDAIPYLYAKEGTSCENLPETHQFLKELRSYIDAKYPDRMLLAEANQWPEDAVDYFGNGDECHMGFNFPVMPRMFMAIQMEDRFPIIDIMEQTPHIPETCQWAMFLRNHDELTLEMVTEEERDYMYRKYAKDPKARINLGIRRRLAPLLENNRYKFELMVILLFSLPGTPVIYYGDEIAMGDNYYLGDRNGVRTPMQWNGDRNAGFSKANPQQLYLPLIIDPEYHYENINVENQEQNLSSILWWMRNVLTIRKKSQAFGKGTITFLTPTNVKILAFVRQFEEETVLIVVNLSRYSQYAELDLKEYTGYEPHDIFSQNKFPRIGEREYGLSLGPYGYFWLVLEKQSEVSSLKEANLLPELEVSSLSKFLNELEKYPKFLDGLQQYLPRCDWFDNNSKKIQRLEIKNKIIYSTWVILYFEAIFEDDSSDNYFIPLALVDKDLAQSLLEDHPKALLMNIKDASKESICFDACYHPDFRNELLQCITHSKVVHNHNGDLHFYRGKALKKKLSDEYLITDSKVFKGEQSNTSLIYGKQFYLKLYRKIVEGVNPDVEIAKHLTEKLKFPYTPPFLGSINLKDKKNNVLELGCLQRYIKSEGDAWHMMLETARIFYDELRASQEELLVAPVEFNFLVNSMGKKTYEILGDRIGGAITDFAALVGQRTAKLHLSLATPEGDASFLPESFTLFDQRAVFETMRKQLKIVFLQLKSIKESLPENIQSMLPELFQHESDIVEAMKVLVNRRFTLLKIRIHGNYHLGQLIGSGKELMITDFQGESTRTIADRRRKKIVMEDVAGMIRSFHYAAYHALYQQQTLREYEIHQMEPWANTWAQYLSHVFFLAYQSALSVSNLPLLPLDKEDSRDLLQAYLLDKSIYEIRYELKNRPDWLYIPLKSIYSLLQLKTSA